MKLSLFICFVTFINSFSSSTINTATINGWCTQTPHYETCNHHVVESNFSSGTISMNQFLDMTVQAAIDEARVVLKRSQGIESKYPNVQGKKLWASCVNYFDGVVLTLNMVIDHTLKPTPLDVQTWLSAGLTYITVCEKGFEMMNITNTILPEMTTSLTQLILNSLAISVIMKGSNNTTELVDWNFQNNYVVSVSEVETPDVVVAQDGSGDLTTIQEAVNSAVYRRRGVMFVIYVKAGIYTEYVNIPKALMNIKMFGDGINMTIITGNRHLGAPATASDLQDSATFQVWGDGFTARDMTFRNTAGAEGMQAVALLSGSDKSAFYRCSIEGYQDTLYTFFFRQFYRECQIFGTVDFIFGDALAVFQDCVIIFRRPVPEGGLVATAHGRRYSNQSSGYSLQKCKITVGDDLRPIIGQFNKAYLGRPWFPHAVTVYMQSFLGDFVDPQGWLDTFGYKETAFYGEYKNFGPGSSTIGRVNWPSYHDIKDPNIAKYFTVSKFIAGNSWLPGTGVPYAPAFQNL